MAASKDNPLYYVYIVSGEKKYHVTSAVISIDIADDQGQMAQSVNVQMLNIEYEGTRLTGIIKVRDRIVIYADDGERKEEVFRGYIWSRSYGSSLSDREISLKCYDNLIYLQESQDHLYFAKGKSTKDVIASICNKWGITLDYTYSSITHSKLALRGNLSDIITADVLDLVKDREGKKYTIRSKKDAMFISEVGTNERIYAIKSGENAIKTHSEHTMSGMVTKVVILGKADDSDRQPVEATVAGKTSQYGTLQKIINRQENTSLADTKKEADGILKESGAPKWEYEVNSIDIPWIRKGDKVYVNAGDIAQKYLIVTSVDRSIGKAKEMTLTLEDM